MNYKLPDVLRAGGDPLLLELERAARKPSKPEEAQKPAKGDVDSTSAAAK